MTELFVIAVYALGALQGFIICAAIYAPPTPFWRSFFDAYTFRFIFGPKPHEVTYEGCE